MLKANTNIKIIKIYILNRKEPQFTYLWQIKPILYLVKNLSTNIKPLMRANNKRQTDLT